MAGALRRMQIVVDAEDNATRKLKQIDRAANDVGDDLDKIQAKGARAKKGFMLAGAGAAVAVAGFAKLVKWGGDIDRQFGRIQGIGAYTADDMSKIRKEALRIGQETPLGIGQATESFDALAKAGYTADQAIKAAGGAADLAIAGNLQMADAVDTVVQSIQTFGMEAQNSITVANTLANTANASTADVSDLGDAMSYAGTAANQVGWSMGETSTAIGVLADAGMAGSKAGTNLENAMRGLIDPTSKAKAAFESVNISVDQFTDKDGNLKNMADIAVMLRDRFDEMGIVGAERQKVLNQMFGVRGARAMGVYINKVDELRERQKEVWGAQIRSNIEDQGKSIDKVVGRYEEMAESGASVEEVSNRIQEELNVEAKAADYLAGRIVNGKVAHDELVGSIENAATAADVAEKEMATLGGQWEEFTGTLETIAYQLYREFEPAVTASLTSLNLFLNEIAQSPGAIKLLAGAFIGLTAALVGATVAFGALYIRYMLLAKAMKMGLIAKSAVGLTGVFQALAVTAGGTLVSALSSLVAILLGPVGIALAVVGAAFIAYKYNILGFRDAVDFAIVGLRKIVQWFGEVVRAGMWLANQLKGPLVSAFGTVVSAFEWIVNAIKGVIRWYDDLSPLGKLIIGIFVPVLPILSAAGKAIRAMGRAVNWLRARWAEFEAKYDPMKIARGAMRMANQVGAAVAPFTGALRQMGSGVVRLAQLAGRAFARVTNALNTRVVNAARNAGRVVGNWLSRQFGRAQRAARSAVRAFNRVIQTLSRRLTGAVRPAAQALRGRLAPGFEAAGQAARRSADLIRRAWNRVKRLVSEAIRAVIQRLKALNRAIENVTGINIGRKLAKGLDFFTDKIDFVRDKLEKLRNFFTNIGKKLGGLWGGGGKGGGETKIKVEGGKEAKNTARNTKQMNAKLNAVKTASQGTKGATNRAANATNRAANRMGDVNNKLGQTNKHTRNAAQASRNSLQADRNAVNQLKQNTNVTRNQLGRLKNTARNTRQAANATKQMKGATNRAAKNTNRTANQTGRVANISKNIRGTLNRGQNQDKRRNVVLTKLLNQGKRRNGIITRLRNMAKRRNVVLTKLQNQGKRRNTLLTRIRNLAKRRNGVLFKIRNLAKRRNNLLKRIQNILRRIAKILRDIRGQLKRVVNILRRQTSILQRIRNILTRQTGLLRSIRANTNRIANMAAGIRSNTARANSLLSEQIQATRSLNGAMQAIANRPVNVQVTAPGGGQNQGGGMAAGGIVTGPTQALIGEGRDDEAVIPLQQFPALMASTVAEAFSTRSGTGGGDVDISIEQSPSVSIDASGQSGLSHKRVRRELEQAMDQAREETLEELDDLLGLGLQTGARHN